MIFGAGLLLAACLSVAAFQIQPQPGKDGWISRSSSTTPGAWSSTAT